MRQLADNSTTVTPVTLVRRGLISARVPEVDPPKKRIISVAAEDSPWPAKALGASIDGLAALLSALIGKASGARMAPAANRLEYVGPSTKRRGAPE